MTMTLVTFYTMHQKSPDAGSRTGTNKFYRTWELGDYSVLQWGPAGNGMLGGQFSVLKDKGEKASKNRDAKTRAGYLRLAGQWKGEVEVGLEAFEQYLREEGDKAAGAYLEREAFADGPRPDVLTDPAGPPGPQEETDRLTNTSRQILELTARMSNETLDLIAVERDLVTIRSEVEKLERDQRKIHSYLSMLETLIEEAHDATR